MVRTNTSTDLTIRFGKYKSLPVTALAGYPDRSLRAIVGNWRA
jgi:hypothetical protein